MATSCLYFLVTILVGQVACMTIPPPPPVSDSAADSVAGWAGQDGMSPPPYFDPGTTTPAQDPNTVTPGTEPPPGGRGAQSQDMHITTGSFDTTTVSEQVTSKQSETGSTAADTMSTVETISVSSEVKVNTSFIKDQSHVSLDAHNVTDSKYVVGIDANSGAVVSDPSIDLPPPPSPHGLSEMKATSSLPGDTQQTSTYEIGTEKVTPKVKEQSMASDVTVQLGTLGSESEAGVPIAYGLSNQLNGRKQNTISDSGVMDNSVAPKQRGTGIEGEVDLNTITLDNSLSSAKGHFVSMGSMVDTSKIGTAGGFNIPTDVFMEDPQSKGSENSLSVNMVQGKTIGGVVISGMKNLPEYTLSDQRSTKDTSGVGVLHEETKTPPPPVVFGADITTSSVTTDMKEMPQAYSTQGIVTERTSVHSGFESNVAQDQSVVSDAGAGVTSPTVVQDVSTDSVHVDTSSASPALGPIADTLPPDQSIISQSGAVSIDTTPKQTAGAASETFEIHQAPTPSDQPEMVEPLVGTDSVTAGTPDLPDHSVSTGIGNVEMHSGVDVTVGVDKGAHGTPPDPYPIGGVFTGSVTVSTHASVDQTIGSYVPQFPDQSGVADQQQISDTTSSVDNPQVPDQRGILEAADQTSPADAQIPPEQIGGVYIPPDQPGSPDVQPVQDQSEILVATVQEPSSNVDVAPAQDKPVDIDVPLTPDQTVGGDVQPVPQQPEVVDSSTVDKPIEFDQRGGVGIPLTHQQPGDIDISHSSDHIGGTEVAKVPDQPGSIDVASAPDQVPEQTGGIPVQPETDHSVALPGQTVPKEPMTSVDASTVRTPPPIPIHVSTTSVTDVDTALLDTTTSGYVSADKTSGISSEKMTSPSVADIKTTLSDRPISTSIDGVDSQTASQQSPEDVLASLIKDRQEKEIIRELTDRKALTSPVVTVPTTSSGKVTELIQDSSKKIDQQVKDIGDGIPKVLDKGTGLSVAQTEKTESQAQIKDSSRSKSPVKGSIEMPKEITIETDPSSNRGTPDTKTKQGAQMESMGSLKDTGAEEDSDSIAPALESLCVNSVFIDGIGFNSYPGFCNKVVQCFQYQGRHVAVLRDCPAGYFWHQEQALCRQPAEVPCYDDPCLNFGVYTYNRTGGCASFYTCEYGISVPTCCKKGYRFDGVDCRPDPTCTDRCVTPTELENRLRYAACKFMPDQHNPYGYVTMEHNGLRIRACPRGTVFSARQCGCTRVRGRSGRRRMQSCSPQFFMDFNHGFNEMSGSNMASQSDNVVINSGAAEFDGTGRITIWGYMDRELGDKFAIRLRFKQTGSKTGFQSIVSNCGMTGAATIEIAVENGNVIFLAKSKEFAETTVINKPMRTRGWNEIIYMYDGLSFRAGVNGDIDKRPLGGYLEKKSNPFLIGGCPRPGTGFKGLVDSIAIYTNCIPRDIFSRGR